MTCMDANIIWKYILYYTDYGIGPLFCCMLLCFEMKLTFRAPQISTTSYSSTTVTLKLLVCMSSFRRAPWFLFLHPGSRKTRTWFSFFFAFLQDDIQTGVEFCNKSWLKHCGVAYFFRERLQYSKAFNRLHLPNLIKHAVMWCVQRHKKGKCPTELVYSVIYTATTAQVRINF